jgi:hypothetical protein
MFHSGTGGKFAENTGQGGKVNRNPKVDVVNRQNRWTAARRTFSMAPAVAP